MSLHECIYSEHSIILNIFAIWKIRVLIATHRNNELSSFIPNRQKNKFDTKYTRFVIYLGQNYTHKHLSIDKHKIAHLCVAVLLEV